ncbi:mandelate racemase/muconate lactonizing enzyme family protein [Alcaligenaceae bacterium]|nr:mandelate racemase/muconate lactonizing enzyme family protein [Alcaligenaceae bacterium]
MEFVDNNFVPEGIKIDRLDVFVFRCPAIPPIQTSFGTMHDRPAVLVRVKDEHGTEGWGEIWCNFPTVGAEHRARLTLAYGRPLIEGKTWSRPEDASHEMYARLQVLMLQTGESGPLHQMMAGIDTAIWDLFARRAELPLWQYLGGAPGSDKVRVYASGINPTQPELLAVARQEEGFRDFKLKVGFGLERDLENLSRMRQALSAEARLMVDANQAWSLGEAQKAGDVLSAFDLLWLEEPLRANAPIDHWLALAKTLPIQLAGGENLDSQERFQDFIDSGAMSVIQPDVGKWGGITGCLQVARSAVRSGRWYCPHWLGAGIGLAASMHLKAAVGGPGYVEIDANANPLREMLARPEFQVTDGCVWLGTTPGLGVVPDLQAARRFRVTSAPIKDD